MWHSILGHPSTYILNKISVVPTYSITFTGCDVYHFSKHHNPSFSNNTSQSTATFDLIHLYVWGPYKQVTQNNYSYFLTVLDDYSKVTWVFLFSSKTQVYNIFKNFIAYVTNQSTKSIIIIRTDNDINLQNLLMLIFSLIFTLCIVHHTTCPATPHFKCC